MRKVLLFLITLFSVAFIYAQNNSNNTPLTNEDFFTKSDLVFEGYFIKVVATYDTKGEGVYDDIYRIAAYKVQRVYKGIQYAPGDTIYVTFQGGVLGEENMVRNLEEQIVYIPSILWNNNIAPSECSSYIFFFVNSNFPDDSNSKYFSKKKYKVTVKFSEEWLYPAELFICGNKIVGLNDLVFNNREELYNYMKQFEGFTVPDLVSSPENKPDKEELNSAVMDSTYIKIREQNRLLIDSLEKEFYKEKEIKDKKKVAPKSKSSRSNYTLTLEIANQKKITETGKNYVTFDLMASSNSTAIYFDKAYAYLKYNTAIFGPSVIGNGKMTVTRGANFTNTNIYTDWVYDLDYSGNADKVWISFFYNSQSRVKLSSTPTALLHFKIELISSTADWTQANLGFFDPTYTATGCFYALSSSGSDKYLYDNVIYNPTTANLPSVTNLAPLSIIAGLDKILTIQGTNFGIQKGNVCFRAADDGGKSYLKSLDDQYIDSWDDTQIKVKVPSLVYKGYSAGINGGGAGSGTIKIKTVQGDSCESVSRLNIPYSVTNGKDPVDNVVRRVYLTRQHCDYDFLFILDPYFKTNPLRVDIIEKALRDWSALTGLKMGLERDATGALVYVNQPIQNNIEGKYIISRQTTGAMATRIEPEEVIISNKKYLYNVTGYNYQLYSYIKINDKPQNNTGTNNPAFSWNYDTLSSVTIPNGYASFYQAFMHELGHILLLSHVNKSSDLMYYSLTSGVHVIKLSATDTAVLAVKQNITDSKAISWPTYNAPPLYSLGSILKATFTTTKSCYGANNGSITTTVTGGVSPYTFIWKLNGVQVSADQNPKNLAPGSYTLLLTDALFCSQNYTVTVLPVGGGNSLSVSFTKIPATQTVPELYKATVSGGVPPYTYKWFSGMIAISTGITNEANRGTTPVTCSLPSEYVYTPQMPTQYKTSICGLSITVTDANGCQISGASDSKSESPANNANDINSDIVIYPNPTTGSFTVSNISEATIYLYSVLSGHIKTFEYVSNHETLNIRNLPSGIYFLKIIENNTLTNRKLILHK